MNASIACRDPRRQTLSMALAMVAIGSLIAATVWGQYASDRTLLALDVAVGIAAWALLPMLPRRPVTATIALDVLALLSPAATPPATAGTLVVARRRDFTVAVTVGALGVAAHAVRGLVRPPSGLPYGWWLVLVVVAHAALIGWGAWSQARHALVASLRERAERAEAEQGRRVAEARAAERTQIAREMHDVLAHRLSLLATYAGALEYRPDAAPEQLSKAAGVIRTGVHQALAELRDVLTVLRDDTAGDGTQAPVLSLADLPQLVAEARDSGTPVELTDGTAKSETLPGNVSRTVYRVVQEGLTNARKHAPGRPVQVTLDGTPGGQLTIELRNPIHATPGLAIPGSGTGLVGLTERVRLAGGSLDHRATHDEFVLRAWLPFPECTT